MRKATHTPILPHCFTGLEYMRCAAERLPTEQGDYAYPCATGLLDIRLANAYINACAYIGEQVPIDCGYRPIGGSVNPCNFGMGLIMGAALGDEQRERLRLRLGSSAAFAKISAQSQSPMWIQASVEIPSPPPHIGIGDSGVWSAILNQLLCKRGLIAAPPDGRFDKATHTAVCLFQKRSGLPVTGSATAATWNALGL